MTIISMRKSEHNSLVAQAAEKQLRGYVLPLPKPPLMPSSLDQVLCSLFPESEEYVIQLYSPPCRHRYWCVLHQVSRCAALLMYFCILSPMSVGHVAANVRPPVGRCCRSLALVDVYYQNQ